MDQLIYVNSWTFFLWLFEAIISKACFYVFNVANPAYLELLSYSGYKFVILCLVVLSEGIFGYTFSYFTFFALATLYAYFFFMTLKRFSHTNSLQDQLKELSLNRKSFLLIYTGVQILLIWLVSGANSPRPPQSIPI